MAKRIRVGILFGGRSAEHEVSLQSAKNIIDAIDTNKFEVVLIGIDKKGQWHLNEESRFPVSNLQRNATGSHGNHRQCSQGGSPSVLRVDGGGRR